MKVFADMGLIMKMARWTFLGILCAAIAVFVSCTQPEQQGFKIADVSLPTNRAENFSHKSYGAYLAGRVAHLRRDFNKASDYYIKALQADPANHELASRLYLILVSKSRIDEAVVYAKQNIANGNKDNFAYTVIAVKDMHDGNYQQSINDTKAYDNPAYKEFIAPLLNAWNYVGLNQPDKALKTLDKLKSESSFKTIYHFHAGLINDYFGRNREAQKHYDVIVNNESMEMSLRTLEIVANFYIRTDQKDKAVALIGGFNNEKALSDILRAFAEEIRNATPQNAKRIINTPSEGAAEALFSIAATFRYDDVIDVAHMFTSLAIYQNPKYDLAKLLLADILEDRGMFEDANEVYESINNASPSYYASQLKKANNFIKLNDYDSAELLLKSLSLDYGTAQVYLDLGDVLRLKNRPEEAIEYYQKAIKKSANNPNNWVLYYALGVSYEQADNWKKAEKNLLKAKKLSKGHYLVLNYLGYTWLKQGNNIDQAFAMIVDAHNQAPDDANITDSYGWALYNLGYYGMAEKYLEKATEAAPANAIISDHLGDVYWFTGRRNEARFQWQHALDLKDENGELDRKAVRAKLENGIAQAPDYKFDKDAVEKLLK